MKESLLFKKFTLFFAVIFATLIANAQSYTFVGSYAVNQGPNWTSNPPVYSAQEAAALIFGGNPTDYVISIDGNTTDPSTITFTGWYDGWGHPGQIFPQNFKKDDDPVGYQFPSITDAAISAYVSDHGMTQRNYVWRVCNPPIALCQNLTVQLDEMGNASISASQIDNGSTADCGIDTLVVSLNTFTCENIGDNTVTLTVTDVNGNFSTCEAIVTVEDNTAPTALCQPITVELDEMGNVSITAEDVDNGSNDACGILSLEVSPNTFSCENVGDNTVTLTVTDVNGNFSACEAIVTVKDNTAPTALCQPITVELDEMGNVSITAEDVDNGSNDACGILSLEVSPSTFDCSNVDIPIISVWINEFHYDNTGTDVGEFIEVAGTAGVDLTGYTLELYNGNDGVIYNTLPLTGIIPNQSNGFGTISYFPNNLQNGAPDGFALSKNGILIQFLSYEGAFTGVGGAADGITSTNIGVLETSTVPVGQSLQLVGTGSIATSFTWASPSVASPGALNAGQTIQLPPTGVPVTLTVTDVNGNVSTCTATVTVEDNEAPEIICPQDIVVNTDPGECSAIVNYETAGTITFSQAFVGGQVSPHCDEWQSFRSQLLSNLPYTKLTIKGSFDPIGVSVTDPAKVLQLADALRTGTPVSIIDGGRNWRVGGCGYDNNNQPAIELSAAGSICSCPNPEYIVRPCIDVYGSNPNWGGAGTATCYGPSQVLTVEFELGNSISGITATDNCSVVITQTAGLPSGSAFPLGTTTNIFVATDPSGNTATCSFDVTVEDHEIPVISTEAVDLSDLGCNPEIVAPEFTATDNCDSEIIPEITTEGPIADEEGCGWSQTWTANYSDASDNAALPVSITYTWKVLEDFVLPENGMMTVSCPSEVLVPKYPVIYDSCGEVLVPEMTVTEIPLCEGKVVYTFTYTDCAEHTHDWLYTYIVDYSGGLVAPANVTTTVFDVANAVAPGAVDILDACGRTVSGVLVDTMVFPDPLNCDGYVVYTYLYTACDGTTTATWTYTYEVYGTPEDPNGQSYQTFCQTAGATLADLEVTADGGPSGMNTLHYYASVSAYQAGTELPSSTLLTNGMTVVISQTTPNGCESIDLLTVVVTLTPPPAAPLAATPQLFCSVEAKTVGDLAVTALAGYSITWYDAATGGNVLASSALLATGNYYASQTSPEGCESVARAMVSVTVTPTPLAPTGAATQTFCASSYPTVASLVAVPTSPNTVITWYNAVGVALAGNTVLQNGVHYYATQTSSAAPYCESVAKLDVEVVIVSVPTPTGDVSQDFCVGDEARVSQLVVSVPQSITVVWYNAATGGTVVTASTLLQNGIYYAEAQNANGCTSLTRLAVEVALNPDCDGDGVLDVQEVDGDTDGDGYVDYLDPNDDDDALNTIDEDSNNDGNWFNDDCNENGVVDYLDPQPCDFVPNAFSPGVNEDGFNDTWVIPALAQYPNFTLEVYDRWGNIVYEYKNEGSVQPQWWDGISNGRWNYKEGEILPTGTYFYIIDFNDGTREPITGWVYLQAQNN